LEQNRQRKLRRAIIEAEKDILAGKVVSRDFKVFFNSNKNNPKFIKACRMI
jgi:predicted alpha-1,6-mannanase (GH76 family)